MKDSATVDKLESSHTDMDQDDAWAGGPPDRPRLGLPDRPDDFGRAEVLAQMASDLQAALPLAGCIVYEWQAADRHLVAIFGEPDSGVTGRRVSVPATGPLADVIASQEPLIPERHGEATGEEELAEAPAAESGAMAYLPLRQHGELLGLVEAHLSPETGRPAAGSLEPAQRVVDRAALGIENSRLRQEALQGEHFLTAAARFAAAVGDTVDVAEAQRRICQHSLALLDYEGASLWEAGTAELACTAAAGLAADLLLGARIARGREPAAFPAAVLERGEATIFGGAQWDSEALWPGLGLPPFGAAAWIPLRQANEPAGVLVLVDSRPARSGAGQELRRLALVGIQAAAALRSVRLLSAMRQLNAELGERVGQQTQELIRSRERVNYLMRVTSELSASLDQDRVLVRALELVNEVVHADRGAILLVDGDTGRLVYPTTYQTHHFPPLPGINLGTNPEAGLFGWIIRGRTAVVIDDLHLDARWKATGDSARLRSALIVPLVAADEVIGLLALFHERPKAFSREQLELVEAAALQVAGALSNAQLFLLIRDQAEWLGKMLRDEHIATAKNQAILESIADGVLVSDPNGAIILANLAACQILHQPRNRLVGQKISELPGIGRETGEAWLRAIDLWGHRAGSDDSRLNLEERFTVTDRIVSIQVAPVMAGGQYFGSVSILRDVTREVEVDRMKSEFVSTVSHELRTPMTSIKGYAELMQMGASGLLSEPQARYVKVIKQNADRMSQLVNDLLDISRIESGRIQLEIRPLDMAQVIRQVVDVHLSGRMQHEGKELQVTVEIAPALPLVLGDHARIQQVLTNLLDNAHNYTPAGGWIGVRAYTLDRSVFVDVADSGIGISKELQEKIFERFFRAEVPEVQEMAGTGLGLAIVRNLVEMHGGQISVHSEPGRGSTFTFNLPVAPAENGRGDTQRAE